MVNWAWKGVYLDYPDAYLLANKEELEAICNGCGPAGWKGDLIPDTMWGLYIGEACNIHDFGYHYAENEVERKECDDLMKKNLYTIINGKSKYGWLASMRRFRARLYYREVREHGKNHIGGAYK